MTYLRPTIALSIGLCCLPSGEIQNGCRPPSCKSIWRQVCRRWIDLDEIW